MQTETSHSGNMSSVEEIEHAIERLPAHDFCRLRAWLWQRDSRAWDQELSDDSAAGRLDFLFQEAAAEGDTGKLRDWPPVR